MQVHAARIRYKGILITFAYSDLSRPRKFIVLAYGLPDVPPHYKDPVIIKLVEAGFVVVVPQYIGTFDSQGRFTIENMAKTVLQTIELIKKGKAKELFGLTEKTWKSREIILIGGSFGGSVVLVAGAKSRDVKKIVAIAPPTDWRTHGKTRYAEEDLMEDYYILKRVYPFTWRLPSKKYWTKFCEGKVDLNAVDYISKLKSKKLLLIHGLKDDSVSAERSKNLYEEIGKAKKKLLLLKNEGHFGHGILRKKRVLDDVLRWIR